MATVNLRPRGGQFGGVEPCGNVTVLRYELETNSSGVPKNTDHASALVVDDVVRQQYPMPAGFMIHDLQVIVSDHFGASVTADVGFAYADGVNDATHPQSATHFGTGLALSATGRIRTASAAALFALPKDAYLTITIKGANIAQAGKLQVAVIGERL